MSLHEECGVFGIAAPEPLDAAEMTYYGLYALQHRGQESCGIVVNDDGVFSAHKDLGLVNEVFSGDILKRFPEGSMAVGHVRYGTTGATDRKNCQPMEVNHLKGRMAIAHNGNLTNSMELRNELELSGAIFHSTSDTETIAYMITKERLKTDSVEMAVSRAMDSIEGAYSLVIMSPQKLICARDPYGFRPLCYGRTQDGVYVAASESCALKAVGAKFIRDVEPGEIIVFYRNGSQVEPVPIKTHCGKQKKKICIFEYIYFSRPDSEIDRISVHLARRESGRILAETYPADADIVIGVPDSGLDAALGFSESSGIPYGIGLIKNKYVGRTFISPGEKSRISKVNIKLSVIEETVRDKCIVLIDDSIVRGTTSSRIIKILRDAGARRIHMRISSPHFIHPCYYGTDIDSEDQLIANRHSDEEIAQMIGADTLAFLPVEQLHRLVGSRDFCAACFDGIYPTRIPSDPRKDRFEYKLAERPDA